MFRVHRSAVLGVALLALGAPSPGEACDSASCALLTRSQSGLFARGRGQVEVSYHYMDQSRTLYKDQAIPQVVRSKVDFERGQFDPFYHHEAKDVDHFVRIDLSYGLSSRFSLMGSVPVLSDHTVTHVYNPFATSGSGHGHGPDGLGSPDAGYQTSGIGDVLAGVRYAVNRSRAHALVGTVALKLPTGPYRRRGDFDNSILDPMIQPGTGSLDLVASVNYSHPMLGLDWFASASYQANTENDIGYRFGNGALGALGASRRFSRFTASIQLKTQHVDRHRFLGMDVPSTGSTSVYVVPGLRIQTPWGSSVYGILQVPTYQYVNESQLAPRRSVLVGLAKDF